MTAPKDSDACSFAVIPDTQMLAAREPDLYLALTTWLAQQADELNLRMVLHLGDVVNNGADDQVQYQVAARAHQKLLDAGVPLLVAAGNHDYDDRLRSSRRLDMFNRYVGAVPLAGQPWFGGTFEDGAAENCYATIDVAGRDFLFAVLEFGPRPKVVTWAERLLAAHPDHIAIMVTHSYLDPDGEHTRPGSPYHPHDSPGSADGIDGEDLWQTSLRHQPNLAAVFCGHQIPDSVSYRVDLGDAGNPVLQSFQNWQETERGGAGRIRIVRWDPTAGIASLRVVNTSTGAWETADGYQIDLTLDATCAGLRYPPLGS